MTANRVSWWRDAYSDNVLTYWETAMLMLDFEKAFDWSFLDKLPETMEFSELLNNKYVVSWNGRQINGSNKQLVFLYKR